MRHYLPDANVASLSGGYVVDETTDFYASAAIQLTVGGSDSWLTGLNTAYAPFQPSTGQLGIVGPNGQGELQLNFSGPTDNATSTLTDVFSALNNIGSDPNATANYYFLDFPASGGIQRVPEPTTIALLTAALGLLSFARRALRRPPSRLGAEHGMA